jgi:hypothetical protein
LWVALFKLQEWYMKMWNLVFVFAVLTVNAFAEAPAATTPATTTPAATAANHTATSAANAATNLMPAAPVFGEGQAFRPAVPPCQPGQGAQSFNSALGIGLGGY